MKYESLWRRLTGIYDADEAKAIVRLVLDVRFGLSLTDIVCGKTELLSETDQIVLEGLMQRLEKGEPVQYVLGKAEFCGRTFHVEPGVLIPRPETAELVQWISQEDSSFGTSVLDIGTGSGCIAITLALEIPEAKVTAWDISEKALAIAQQNAITLDADVVFEQRDILNLKDQNTSHTSDSWDIIVSNPPYICDQEKAAMERHVLEHEPHLALFVPDDDPLRFYRAIAHYAKKTLTPNGMLYFELNPLYAHETEVMVQDLGFTETEIKQDMFGKQRFLKTKRI